MNKNKTLQIFKILLKNIMLRFKFKKAIKTYSNKTLHKDCNSFYKYIYKSLVNFIPKTINSKKYQYKPYS